MNLIQCCSDFLVIIRYYRRTLTVQVHPISSRGEVQAAITYVSPYVTALGGKDVKFKHIKMLLPYQITSSIHFWHTFNLPGFEFSKFCHQILFLDPFGFHYRS